MRTLIIFCLLALFSLPAIADDKESAYDRVMRTGTIRCGYFLYPPVLMKDPNSGKFSGIFYDYIEALAKNLSLKVDWAEEIGLADYPAALESGRIDAYCAGTWIRGSRARVHDYIEPLYYLPLYVYVRKDDHRFDKDPYILNAPQYTLAILEGGATETVRQELFEKSKAYTLSQLTSPAELFMSLAEGKADALIYDPFQFQNYDKNNPGILRQASQEKIKIFPNAVAIARGQQEFQRMLSLTTQEMHLSGQIEKIIDNYETYNDSIFRPSLPYEAK